MKADKTNIQELWDLFVSDKATEQQVHALFEYIKSTDQDDEHIAYFKEALSKVPPSLYKTDDATAQSILDTIIAANEDLKHSLDTAAPPIHRVYFLRRWWAAAASVMLLLGIGAYLWTTYKKNLQPPAIATTLPDIAPGKNGAILTLADGSQVVLDSLNNGVIAQQNGSQAAIKNGALVYDRTGETAGQVVYNTMTTPQGRQFSLLLPDGSKVWLNAASSIRYPTVFNGKERKVEVTGEVYFEIAQNTKRPFLVNVNNKAEVEVLGTHFNVNAYGNEETINTTLITGSVRVISGQSEGAPSALVLKPGQQAQIQRTQPGIKMIDNVNIDKVMAWKNGLIYFDGATFEEIMRQVERWYDIKVVYENNKVPNIRLAGEMTRDVSLNDLLKYLGKMDVRYKIDGRTLIVSDELVD